VSYKVKFLKAKLTFFDDLVLFICFMMNIKKAIQGWLLNIDEFGA
jgi:hypothetical protein